jgi:hypothetical protein
VVAHILVVALEEAHNLVGDILVAHKLEGVEPHNLREALAVAHKLEVVVLEVHTLVHTPVVGHNLEEEVVAHNLEGVLEVAHNLEGVHSSQVLHKKEDSHTLRALMLHHSPQL